MSVRSSTRAVRSSLAVVLMATILALSPSLGGTADAAEPELPVICVVVNDGAFCVETL